MPIAPGRLGLPPRPDPHGRAPDAPFFLAGPDREDVCLLVHGSTGTAGDMRFLGEFLHARGFAVEGVSLPGHRRRPAELRGVGWEVCYAVVREAWLGLAAQYRRVHVVGFSFGGSLALHLAAREPVADLVLLAPALFVRMSVRAILLTILGLFPGTPAHSRVRWNLGLVRFFRLVARDVERVDCSLLAVHARDDATVHLDSSLAIFDRVASRDRRLRVLQRGGHLLPHGAAREAVWEEVGRHLAARRAAGGRSPGGRAPGTMGGRPAAARLEPHI